MAPHHALFLNLHSVHFFFFFFFFFVKSLSKSDKNLESYKTFCFCSAEMNLAKFMINTSTVVDCFNPLFIVT